MFTGARARSAHDQIEQTFSFVWIHHFIRFGSLMVKLQSFFEHVSVLKVCKLNTNYADKFYKCSRKKLLPNVHQNIFFDI